MNWISRFIGKLTYQAPAPPVDMKPSFDNQIRWESEGKAAGLAGKTSTDCPYETGTSAWNHWVYGRDVAMAPKMVRLDGSGMWFSTDSRELPAPAAGSYLLKHPDGHFTTPDGAPATPLKSSDMLPPGAGDFLNPKPRWDKDGKFIGWST